MLVINNLKVLILCFISIVLFTSCSSDDDSDSDNNIECSSDNAELPDSFLGTYTSTNDDFTVTILESDPSCNVYTISFSNDFPSITDITFIAVADGLSYIDRVVDERERTITIGFSEEEDIHVIGVISDNPVIFFGGEK